jgi:hypothetical protein
MIDNLELWFFVFDGSFMLNLASFFKRSLRGRLPISQTDLKSDWYFDIDFIKLWTGLKSSTGIVFIIAGSEANLFGGALLLRLSKLFYLTISGLIKGNLFNLDSHSISFRIGSSIEVGSNSFRSVVYSSTATFASYIRDVWHNAS